MPKPRVLVVEDTQSHVDLITYHLHHVGFTVTVAFTAEEAIAILRSGEPIQMALVDIKLPGMPGTELIHIIKRDWPQIVVSVISAHLPESDWPALRDAGATILFGKPFMDKDAYYLLEMLNVASQAFERGRKHRSKSDYWRYGLASAFVGGFASMIESGVAITIIAPEKFQLHQGLWKTVITIVGLALFNAIKFSAAYLKQSPMPFMIKPPNGNGHPAISPKP